VHEMRHPTGDFIEYFESLVAAQGLELARNAHCYG